MAVLMIWQLLIGFMCVVTGIDPLVRLFADLQPWSLTTFFVILPFLALKAYCFVRIVRSRYLFATASSRRQAANDQTQAAASPIAIRYVLLDALVLLLLLVCIVNELLNACAVHSDDFGYCELAAGLLLIVLI